MDRTDRIGEIVGPGKPPRLPGWGDDLFSLRRESIGHRQSQEARSGGSTANQRIDKITKVGDGDGGKEMERTNEADQERESGDGSGSAQAGHVTDY